ncbi:hypothetical protein [Calderihabitans maritimus]|uniref:Uncharacterized protein n=1 Tax=Calderihabitans maritimus TaxID=1246530 RepID=A0A1Z5HTH9_9FIRM|nr:hypothetical protein [Calderihabitans maritimus]GAW92647.1 hypothetical protein KKC1_17980 [Calderihabitans maritimus]
MAEFFSKYGSWILIGALLIAIKIWELVFQVGVYLGTLDSVINPPTLAAGLFGFPCSFGRR